MVMPLPLPGTDCLALIDAVVAERTKEPNKSFFQLIAAEWKVRVGVYIAHGGSPAQVQTWPAAEAKGGAFKNLYSHPAEGSVQGAMLEALRDHDLDICPACGSPTPPETLDHYLPKGRYPQFAITPVNLTPMCDPCQRRKKEKTGNAVSPRFFIHPYFDAFSLPQILQLEVAAPFATPTFSLTPHPDLTVEETALVTTHMRELQVARRYVRFFRNEHRRLLRNVSKMRSTGLVVVDNIAAWQEGHAHPTTNSWHHLFYDAVTRNTPLVDYLTNGDLPAFL